MSEDFKYYSEIEKYEIININDGEKYACLSNNDVVIDEKGYLKLLILSSSKNKFTLWSNREYIEVPWQYVKKIGTKTIIIDFDESKMKTIKF